MNTQYKCLKCKKYIDASDTYEYRGVYSCAAHFEEVCAIRDFQRNEIIKEEHNKTKAFKGLDLSDSVIGKANKEILKSKIEIAKKESSRLTEYERPKK